MKCSRVRERMHACMCVCCLSVLCGQWAISIGEIAVNIFDDFCTSSDISMFVSHDFRIYTVFAHDSCASVYGLTFIEKVNGWHIRIECDSINIFSIFLSAVPSSLFIVLMPLMRLCDDKMNQSKTTNFK